MKRGITTLLSVAGSLVFATALQAASTENPYQPIIERNVFGLKPPPPPPGSEADAAKQPPPTIFLTGITTILGNKRALLVSTPAAKPGEKPVQESYMLTEGQRDGEVEMVQIDEQKGIVKIRLAGKEMDLDFEKNGVKIASAPPPAPSPIALPGFPGRPGGPIPPPQPQARPLGNAFGGVNNIPTMPRTLRGPNAVTTPTGQNGTGYASPGYSGMPTVRTPGGTLGLAQNSFNNQQAERQPDMTAEEQAILMEANRMRLKAANDPSAGLIPPTSISQ